MLTIKSIPAFNDNYIWLIHNSTEACAVVDPGDAAPVLSYIEEHGLTLEAILLTHHHNDHTGGVAALHRAFPQVKIVGPKNDAIANLTHSMSEGDQLSLFDVTFSVLDLPGHTNGHIGFFGDNKLFCGDVLFSAGCGRIFEGTTEQMFDSVNKISALPDSTEIYCAHEYTASNIVFALAAEPDNRQLQLYRDEVQQLRSQQKSTIPTSLLREKSVNPFLRTTEPTIIQSVSNRTKDNSPIEIFAALRQWKNDF
ncbi:hydroxyacylglutathione hydrolase [Vibrio hannami]|uniref:hydroxyacylglutathione hydrolase n=1 Tax=Vibrio hannami TaxID=2717094 RepID=UPI0024102532|nr:hydroxyacylglutathione hydrolase [Vibrio hannami]MDG3088849.1 hydroxyacylglutathione hydrolase [Vibrio hannami]